MPVGPLGRRAGPLCVRPLRGQLLLRLMLLRLLLLSGPLVGTVLLCAGKRSATQRGLPGGFGLPPQGWTSGYCSSKRFVWNKPLLYG